MMNNSFEFDITELSTSIERCMDLNEVVSAISLGGDVPLERNPYGDTSIVGMRKNRPAVKQNVTDWKKAQEELVRSRIRIVELNKIVELLKIDSTLPLTLNDEGDYRIMRANVGVFEDQEDPVKDAILALDTKTGIRFMATYKAIDNQKMRVVQAGRDLEAHVSFIINQYYTQRLTRIDHDSQEAVELERLFKDMHLATGDFQSIETSVYFSRR